MFYTVRMINHYRVVTRYMGIETSITQSLTDTTYLVVTRYMGIETFRKEV